jgi:hypothetical protein
MFVDQKTETISSPTCSNIVNCRTDFLPYFEAYLEFLPYFKLFTFSTISCRNAIGPTCLFWPETCVLGSAFLAVSPENQGCLSFSPNATNISTAMILETTDVCTYFAGLPEYSNTRLVVWHRTGSSGDGSSGRKVPHVSRKRLRFSCASTNQGSPLQ